MPHWNWPPGVAWGVAVKLFSMLSWISSATLEPLAKSGRAKMRLLSDRAFTKDAIARHLPTVVMSNSRSHYIHTAIDGKWYCGSLSSSTYIPLCLARPPRLAVAGLVTTI
jgi:hypothetical protein